jgi:hypothetical protein
MSSLLESTINLPEDPVDSEENRARQGMFTGLGEVGKIGQISRQDARKKIKIQMPATDNTA